MSVRMRLSAIAVLALFAGCLPTLNPVYQDDQLKLDADVLGVWQAKSRETWEFTKRDSKSYRLRYTDKNGRQGKFVARLAEIENTRFLDLFPDQDDKQNNFYRFHVVPIHTVFLIKQTEPDLELAAIDHKWLGKLLTENPQEIQTATFNGRQIITAPTKHVQKFVLAHKAKFNAGFKLKRRSGNGK